MKRKRFAVHPRKVESVREQFERWRKTRQKRSRIPERLWRSAVALCRDSSVSSISRALRLNHGDLQRRVADAGGAVGFEKKSGNPVFVELEVGQPVVSAECVIEIEDCRGARMGMQLKGQANVDLVALVRAFWSQGA